MTDGINQDEIGAAEAPSGSPDRTDGDPPAVRAGSAAATADDPLDELRREKAALHDRLLRTAADFENYRKRIERDRRDQADAALIDAIADLLPIIDNLERALEAPTGGDVESYRKGVELIHQQMTDLLRKRGVTPIEAVGADFDPHFHQAVVYEAHEGRREGEVIEELRRGYRLGDRLIRPAMVKVAKA